MRVRVELSERIGTSDEEPEHETQRQSSTPPGRSKENFGLKTDNIENGNHQTNAYDSRISKIQRSTLRSGSDKTADEGSMQQSPNGTSISVSSPQTSPNSRIIQLSIRFISQPKLEKRQKQLDLLRDSREKMLVNMKYNDRERAKSFIESNKKILMAMKEEERRRKMAAIEWVRPPNVHSASNQATNRLRLLVTHGATRHPYPGVFSGSKGGS